jgi:hypothetical protein
LGASSRAVDLFRIERADLTAFSRANAWAFAACAAHRPVRRERPSPARDRSRGPSSMGRMA